MMSETVRDKIAESMKLSKTPISTKRARELMIHPAASKIRNDAGQGQGSTDSFGNGYTVQMKMTVLKMAVIFQREHTMIC